MSRRHIGNFLVHRPVEADADLQILFTDKDADAIALCLSLILKHVIAHRLSCLPDPYPHLVTDAPFFPESALETVTVLTPSACAISFSFTSVILIRSSYLSEYFLTQFHP